MAAFNFPNSPSTNDVHTENGVSWKWNGTVWKKVASPDTIAKADSKVQVVDAGTGGYITAETDGTQRLRIQNSGAIVTGILTATSFKGDGSALTGITDNVVTINNNANNKVITGSGSANTLEAEASLTFDAGLLKIDDLGGTAGKGRLEFGNSGEQYIEGYDTGNAGSSSYLTIGSNTTEALRIDSSGRVIVGHTATDDRDGYNSALQVSGTGGDDSSVSIGRWSGDASASGLVLSKSRNGTIGSHTVLQANDLLGVIQFQGDDGTNYHVGAQIQADIVSGVGNDDMPADLIFKTNGGSTSTTERLRITSGGTIRIGGATSNSADIDASNSRLTIKQSANSREDGIYIERSGERRGWYQYVGGGLSSDDALCFDTNQLGTDTSVLALDRSGVVKIAGNLGVGINDPSQARLVAQSASGTQIAAIKDNTGASISLGGVTQPRILMESDPSSAIFKLYTAGGSSYGSASWSEKVRVTSDGELRQTGSSNNLGQGDIIAKYTHHTLDPTTPGGAGEVFKVYTYSANANGADYSTWLYKRAGSAGGECGIRLGGSADGSINFYTSPNSSTAYAERLRIDSGGSVTIGDAATHALSAHSEGDDLVVGGAGWRGMTIYGEGGGGVIQFADNGSNRVGQLMYNHGDNSMLFRVNGNQTRLMINSTGGVGIGTVNYASDLDNRPGLAIHSDHNDSCRLLITTPTKAPTRLGYFGLNRFGIDVQHGFEIRDVAASYATRLLITSTGEIDTGSKTITGGNNLATQAIRVKRIYSGSPSIGKSAELISGYDGSVKMAAVAFNLTDTNVGGTYGGDVTIHTQPLYSSPTTPLPVRMRINSSGMVTTPNQPGFLAKGRGGYSASIDSNWGIIYPNSEVYDTLGNHNLSTGTFTAPVGGKYLFFAYGLIYPMPETNFSQIRFVRNGSTYGQLMQFSGTEGNHRNISMSVVASLSKNDTFAHMFYRSSGQGQDVYGGQWNWGGVLLG